MSKKQTVIGQIEEIYETSRPTRTITQARFRLREHETNESFYMTCFNNLSILKGFAAGDWVEVEYNTRISVKRDVTTGEEKTYTNQYANRIKRITPPADGEVEPNEQSSVVPPAVKPPPPAAQQKQEEDEGPF